MNYHPQSKLHVHVPVNTKLDWVSEQCDLDLGDMTFGLWQTFHRSSTKNCIQNYPNPSSPWNEKYIWPRQSSRNLFWCTGLWASILVIFTSAAQFYRPKLFFYYKVFKECTVASSISWQLGLRDTSPSWLYQGEPLLCTISFLGIIIYHDMHGKQVSDIPDASRNVIIIIVIIATCLRYLPYQAISRIYMYRPTGPHIYDTAYINAVMSKSVRPKDLTDKISFGLTKIQYFCCISYCSDWQDFQNQSKWLACPKKFQYLCKCNHSSSPGGASFGGGGAIDARGMFWAVLVQINDIIKWTKEQNKIYTYSW